MLLNRIPVRKEIFMTSGPAHAVERFNTGLNCAQAIFSTYSERYGLDSTSALRVACGFGAGMGRRQEVCGAVTGAIMLAGLKYTRQKENGTETKEEMYTRIKEDTYSCVNRICDRFRDLHGSVNCRELLQCDISTATGMQFARENNLFSAKCALYVKDMAEIIEAVL
jgi:C_GCAxxG_C_C family probable redox protein